MQSYQVIGVTPDAAKELLLYAECELAENMSDPFLTEQVIYLCVPEEACLTLDNLAPPPPLVPRSVMK